VKEKRIKALATEVLRKKNEAVVGSEEASGRGRIFLATYRQDH
jgi:hypothetical protein